MKVRILLLLFIAGWLMASIIPADIGNKWYYKETCGYLGMPLGPDTAIYIYQIDDIQQVSLQKYCLYITVKDSSTNIQVDTATFSRNEQWELTDSSFLKGNIVALSKTYLEDQVINSSPPFYNYSVDIDSVNYNDSLHLSQAFSFRQSYGIVSHMYGIKTIDGLGFIDFYEEGNNIQYANYHLYAVEFNGNFTPVSVSQTSSINENLYSCNRNDLFLSNYPNPFNNTTMISFENPVMAKVKLTVFDSTGREVVQLINQNFSGGKHTVAFNAEKLNSGVYFYRLELNGKQSAIQKMLLVK